MIAKLKHNVQQSTYEIVFNGKVLNKFKNKQYAAFVLSNSEKLKSLDIDKLIDADTGEEIKKFRSYSSLTSNEKIKFHDSVGRGALIRKYIDEDLHPVMNKLAELFSIALDLPKKQFKHIKNMLYYQGGYPHDDSLPKLQELCNTFGETCSLYDYIGKLGEINAYLSQFNIQINITKNSLKTNDTYYNSLDSKMKRKFNKLWAEISSKQIIKDKHELISSLFDNGVALQGKICSEADKIKIDEAELIESTLGITKWTFVSVVKKMAKKLKTGLLKDSDFKPEITNITNNNNILEACNG